MNIDDIMIKIFDDHIRFINPGKDEQAGNDQSQALKGQNNSAQGFGVSSVELHTLGIRNNRLKTTP